MENSRDSSVWRSLAVALGDGLAFGVGMALSQKAARRDAAPLPELGPAGERLKDLERRMGLLENAPVRLDPKILETIVGVFEADLRDRDEQWSRRLAAAVESAAAAVRQEHADAADGGSQQLAAELGDRDAQWNQRLAAEVEFAKAVLREEHAEGITNLRQDVVADLRTLESQGIAFQQEITEAIPRIIEERIAARLNAGALDAAMERKLDAWRLEIAERDREIANLRERVAASEQRTLDLLGAIGQAFRQAAQRTSPAPPASPEPEPQPAVEAARTLTEPSAETALPPASDDAPRFEVEPAPKWTLPLVSSLLVASGCFVFLQHWF
jgi:hypothetical protein